MDVPHGKAAWIPLDLHRKWNLSRIQWNVLARQLWDRSRNVQRWRRVQSREERRQGRVEEVGGDKVGVEGGVEQVGIEPSSWIRGNQIGKVRGQVT